MWDFPSLTVGSEIVPVQIDLVADVGCFVGVSRCGVEVEMVELCHVTLSVDCGHECCCGIEEHTLSPMQKDLYFRADTYADSPLRQSGQRGHRALVAKTIL